MIETVVDSKASRFSQHEPVYGGAIPEVIQFGASIIDAIDSHFDGSPMRESAEDNLREMYTETYLALAQSLLFIFGKQKAGIRLELAKKRLQDRCKLDIE